MLITRDILNKALEDKMPLFHDGDYIDDVFCMICFVPQQKCKFYLMERKVE